MAKTTNLSIRIDRDLKEEADMVFNALGMNLTTAITVFVRQAVRQKKIPFEITLNVAGSERRTTTTEAMVAPEYAWQASAQNETDKKTASD
ncbi:MAG: type II toxin-antitoxin system RelB/DinJ family antitoxin [Clostridiales Family XIII bacterium]|jgi:DNA-damage-inducible protein J|nr:type II toxin-antitoxin system RelB/DinJ family antitoxin [Clostridiales Family XIII bacterium]